MIEKNTVFLVIFNIFNLGIFFYKYQIDFRNFVI